MLNIMFGFSFQTLEALAPASTQSPEDFLASIEQQLEDGDITEDEAVLLIQDYCRR